MIKRIMLLVAVAAFMVAMMVATAAPGFAQILPEESCHALNGSSAIELDYWQQDLTCVVTPPTPT